MIDLAYILEHAFKRCNHCKELKLNFPEWFYRNKRFEDGLASCCSDCCKERYKNNREKILDHQAHSYSTNRERIYQSRKQQRQTEEGRAQRVVEKSRRKAKRAGVVCDITADEWIQILNNSNGCYWCTEPFVDGHV